MDGERDRRPCLAPTCPLCRITHGVYEPVVALIRDVPTTGGLAVGVAVSVPAPSTNRTPAWPTSS
jgi:hypothetical protein